MSISIVFVFNISSLPIYRVKYYDYIVEWCSGVACNWCISLDFGLSLALTHHSFPCRRTGKSRRKAERKRWSLREGGPQEEVALVDTLAKIIHRVDDMKGEGARERVRDGGREGGPQEEMALVDTLAKIIHRVDDMKGEGGRKGGRKGGREGGREDLRRRWL